jgi:hypothetical protein
MGISRKLWIVFLWLESVFLLSVAFISQFALKQTGATAGVVFNQFFWMCIGGAILGLVIACYLSFQNHRAFQRLKALNFKKAAPVDLEECFRAAKAFGYQNPLFQDGFFKSEVFSIENRKSLDSESLLFPKYPCRVLVEHWSGPDLIIDDGVRKFQVGEKNLIKFDMFERSHLNFTVKKDFSQKRARATGVIHVIRLPESAV